MDCVSIDAISINIQSIVSDNQTRRFQVGTVFTPSAPISKSTLFAGRSNLLTKVINSINQVGQHAIIYGERGVGKTSLANVIQNFLPNNEHITTVKINCDEGMSFADLFCHILEEINFNREKKSVGFDAKNETETINLKSFIDDKITPHKLRILFSRLPNRIIIIIDELDRIKDEKTRREIADTIKNFSDYTVNTTFILVGVSDSVENLISGHLSIERALVQIKMPRMSKKELNDIINKGVEVLGITIESDAREKIVTLSQGLPHYTHLLALHASQVALEEGMTSNTVTTEVVDQAIEIAIESTQQSILDDYHKAISSPKGNLYKQVLLACAMAENNETGNFSASDVKGPMKKIMRKTYEISSFSKHLKQFCDENRGFILKKTGSMGRFRYKFNNPLMEPYVIMNGLSKKLIKERDLI